MDEDEKKAFRKLVEAYGDVRDVDGFCGGESPDRKEKLEAVLRFVEQVCTERDTYVDYLEKWQNWSRKLHHEFKWLPETTWPDDTKGRQKIEDELRQLQQIRALSGEICPDCGGCGRGPLIIPYPGEPPETPWCPTCEGGGYVTKEYLRLRNNADAELLKVVPGCKRCENRSTMCCLDAAGDPVYTCDDHKFVGGMLDDDKPVDLKWAQAVRRVQKKASVTSTPARVEDKMCNGSCDPMCAWCNEQADIAAENRDR